MILFCTCAYSDIIPETVKEEALARLRATDMEIRMVPDLCGLAVQRDPLLSTCANAADLTIVACYPRAVQALFAWAGAPLDPSRVRFINLREAVSQETLPSAKPAEWPVVDRAKDWIPWFPVIDRARCVNCRQCLEFCLFGVYELSANGEVTVTHPSHCKTNCPACARLCPEGAIMFPKHNEAPIDGSEIADERAVRASADAAGKGDLRAALEERRKRRRDLLKPEYRPGNGDGPV